MVSSEPAELRRIRDGFCRKKLALSDPDESVDSVIELVCDSVGSDQSKAKARFAIYYLLADHYEKLDLFHKKS